MYRNLFLSRLLSVIFVAIMCNAIAMPVYYTVKDVDFSYDSLTLTEEENNCTNNLIEEEKKLHEYTSFFNPQYFEILQDKRFASKRLFLNDNYFKEIFLPPPELV